VISRLVDALASAASQQHLSAPAEALTAEIVNLSTAARWVVCVLENEYIRVLEVTIGPGEREPEHTHRRPSVMLVDRPARIRYYTGSTLTYTSPEQLPAQTATKVSWLDPEGPHSVENIDQHPYGAFRIEFKRDWRTSITPKP
jgi:hypothetical protein